MELNHEEHMLRAIGVACQNLKRPFGSVIVDRDSGAVVAEGINKSYRNPVWHSEIAAINACAHDGDPQWGRYVLYTTAEPCPMCMTAILWTGIPTVVYGTSMSTLAELGFRQVSIPAAEVIDRARNLWCEVITGVLQSKCDELFTAASRLEKLA